MRAFGQNRSQGPSVLVAIAIFVGLLLAVQLFRDRVPDDTSLVQQFAARRPDPAVDGQVLPPLPSSVAGLARTTIARIGRGSAAPALTPVAEQGSLRVEIASLRKVDAGLRITGRVTNIGQAPVAVSLAPFRFSDGAGTVYAADNAAATTLQPGQQAPLDLTLPIEAPRQLVLDVQLEGQPPIRMVLMQEG